MKMLWILLVAITLLISFNSLAFGQDGGAIFKAKCAGCHGPEGQGKVGPALKGTALSADQIVDLLTKGEDSKKPPHKKPMIAVSADDAKALAACVKSLK